MAAAVRYENWIAGKDLGHHPEDDPKTCKMSLAPQPSLDEFMVNKTNINELVKYGKHGGGGGADSVVLDIDRKKGVEKKKGTNFNSNFSYGYTKLETQVPVRTLLSHWGHG